MKSCINNKIYELRYGYYENYFIKNNKTGSFSIDDISNLLQANTCMFFDCVAFENDKIVFINKNKTFDVADLKEFINIYKNDIEKLFCVDFEKQNEQEKFNLLSRFFELAQTLQENTTFVESKYKTSKEKAFFEIDNLFDRNDDFDDERNYIFKMSSNSNYLVRI